MKIIMNKEVWKTIKDYDSYEASNLGNIRRINKFKNLKPSNDRGRLMVRLFNNEGSKSFSVAYIVAKTFIVNNNNYKYVKHKNGDKLDNRVVNLEWYDDAYKISNSNPVKILNTNYSTKKIFKLDIKNNITRYNSITEAAKDNNTSITSIVNYLRGKRKNKYGDYYYYE